jgi:hypothetical protein
MEKLMEKPILKQAEPYLEINAVLNYIDEKYKIKTGDYAGVGARRDKWQKDNNCNLFASPQHYNEKYYAWIDGKHTQVTFDEYTEQVKIHQANSKKFFDWEKAQGELPYLVYLDWITEHLGDNIINGKVYYLNLKEILSGNAPQWAKEITKMISDEFNQYTVNDELRIQIEW